MTERRVFLAIDTTDEDGSAVLRAAEARELGEQLIALADALDKSTPWFEHGHPKLILPVEGGYIKAAIAQVSTP